MKKKSLKLRILEALMTFPEGRARYHLLMYKVWPEDQYPRAYRHSHNGGPPGVSWVLGGTLNRMHHESLIARPATMIGGKLERYGQPDVWITSIGKKLVEESK